MLIPTFRNEIEAGFYAAKVKPLQAATSEPVDEAYYRRYGDRAGNAATHCRIFARMGRMDKLALYARSLSTILAHECPHLFEQRERRSAA